MNEGQGDHSRMLYATDVKSAEFQPWPKTPRLFKPITITEKIDGTNACVVITEHSFGTHVDGLPKNAISLVIGPVKMDAGESVTEYVVYAQSRKRMITPEADNAGFAQWVRENAQSLVAALGPGRHYGEWWGRGIQRNYGATRKMFSLFNTDKWSNLPPEDENWGLSVVPELYRGEFDTDVIRYQAESVWEASFVADPSWDGHGEGVCVFHHASRQVFKVTDAGDMPKGGPRDEHDNVISLFGNDLAASGFYSSEPDIYALPRPIAA